jgi:sterol desaturase/sphingolipid hydroxylase (fatty acid hydroxylase superfamily)
MLESDFVKCSRHGCLYRTKLSRLIEHTVAPGVSPAALSIMLNPMPKIPLMDYVGRPLLACLFLALLLLQWRYPLCRQHFSMLHRLLRNFALSIPGLAIVRLAMLPIPLAVAMWAQDRHIGLLNCFSLPGWAAAIATFLLMDYAYWWWHWVNHMVPLFWRFRNVHHTDLDVSTAARFHFGEMFFSVGFLSLTVMIFGIAPVMLAMFSLPLRPRYSFIIPTGDYQFRSILNMIVVTPRMHRIHHSIVQRETNSNGGRSFAGGTRCIAHYAVMYRRMPLPLGLLRIARNTS